MCEINNRQIGRTRRLLRTNPRLASGTGLIESAMFLVVMSGLFAFVAVFVLNSYTAQVTAMSLRNVADETAKVIQSKRYWLGRERADWDQISQQQRRQEFIYVADTLCERMKIPHISADDFEYKIEEGDEADYVTVNVTLKNVKLPFCGVAALPTTFSTSATGTAVTPHDEVYAVLNMDALKPGDPNAKLGVQIPVYGYFTGIGSQPTPIGTVNASAYQQVIPNLPNGFAPLCQGPAKYLAGLPMVPPTAFAQGQVTNGTVTGFNH